MLPASVEYFKHLENVLTPKKSPMDRFREFGSKRYLGEEPQDVSMNTEKSNDGMIESLDSDNSSNTPTTTTTEMKRGLFILFEGIDRCGKSTQVASLQNYITSTLGRKSKNIRFPAYSAAKGLDFDWCFKCETGLPAPDLVIYLQMSTEDATKRGDYGNERYEKLDFQTKIKDIYESKLIGPNWRVVGGTVTLSGQDLTLPSKVTIGNKTCTDIKLLSDKAITCYYDGYVVDPKVKQMTNITFSDTYVQRYNGIFQFTVDKCSSDCQGTFADITPVSGPSSASMKLTDTTQFTVNITAINEIDSNGKIIQSLDVTKLTWTQKDNSSYQHVYEATNDTLTLTITTHILSQGEQANSTFGGQNIHSPSSSIEHEMALGKWPFATVDNKLQIISTIFFPQKYTINDKEVESKIDSTLINNKRVQSVDVDTAYGTIVSQFPSRAILDEKIIMMDISILDQSADNLRVAMTVPSFTKTFGGTVTLSGQDLTLPSNVTIGNNTCTDIKLLSDKAITCYYDGYIVDPKVKQMTNITFSDTYVQRYNGIFQFTVDKCSSDCQGTCMDGACLCRYKEVSGVNCNIPVVGDIPPVTGPSSASMKLTNTTQFTVNITAIRNVTKLTWTLKDPSVSNVYVATNGTFTMAITTNIQSQGGQVNTSFGGQEIHYPSASVKHSIALSK
eukprot:gene15921-18926_t